MFNSKPILRIAFFFFLLLAVKTGGDWLQECLSSSDKEQEWVLDLEREQENKETRSAEVNAAEEFFERSGTIQFFHLSFSAMAVPSEPTDRLPRVYMDTNTPPPNFC